MDSHNLNLWKLILLLSILFASGCSTNVNIAVTKTPTFTPTITNIPTLTPTVTVTPLPFKGKIAFVSDRSGKFCIYAMNANGSNQKNLTNGLAYSSEPAWSPDGKYIAFSSNKDDVSEIYLMNADGSDQTQLTFDKASSYTPAWSPNGKYIIFRCLFQNW